MHTIIGLIAVSCSILVATKINSFDKSIIEWISFFSALSIGILSSFNLGDKANRCRKGWRILRTACFRYQLIAEYSEEELIKAYEEAENIIGDVKEEPISKENNRIIHQP